MAISETHYRLLMKLRDDGAIKPFGCVLEIGKANWYGDAPPSLVSPDLADDADGFDVAAAVYRQLFAPSSVAAIDLDPLAKDAERSDLNALTWGLGGIFQTVINHGTAEHIFNIANVFKVMHDATAVGGLMIHEGPFTGWVDHGFYCLQPTLFWDVAAANEYEIVLVVIEHLASKTAILCESREAILEMARRDTLPYNSMLFVALRKKFDAPFRVPMQGVYAGGVSESVQQAWRELR